MVQKTLDLRRQIRSSPPSKPHSRPAPAQREGDPSPLPRNRRFETCRNRISGLSAPRRSMRAIRKGPPAPHLSDAGDSLQSRLSTEEHTSELQSLLRISYAVIGLQN